jgi:integrase
MPRRAKGLTATQVKTLGPGRYGDGMGLYLYVRSDEAKFWTFRYHRDGRAREMGLGPAVGKHPISLAQARQKAYQYVDQLRSNLNPLDEQKAQIAAKKAELAAKAIKSKTFKEVAEEYIKKNEVNWKGKAHRNGWRTAMRDYIYPTLQDVPVGDVTKAHITTILDPIWQTKNETASRVRSRIQAILDYATAKDWYHGDNPAAWSTLRHIYPERGAVAPVEHHASLPWDQVPALMAQLDESAGMGALCLKFLTLTAVRSMEARGALWGEIDLDKRSWTIPKGRMKMKEPHIIPLSNEAVAILEGIRPEKPKPDELVFAGAREGRPLTDVSLSKALNAAGADDFTVHGLRSSFRTWAADYTHYPREIAEKCLAHAVSSKVEAAYLKTSFYDRRRQLMAEWATFCSRPYTAPKEAGANVTQLHPAAA